MATITMPTSALIVVIDDDDSARAAMVSLVAAMSFDTRAFANASAFLTSDLRTSDIRSAACLISDVRMPGMSGLELYLTLCASGRAIPTILVTAYPDDTTKARALEAGVHGYLAKPFDPEVLLACLHEALRARPAI